MPNTTNNNNRPIATKGSDHVAAATAPDVHWKVGTRTKVSFPNTVESKLLKKGATTNTFIDGHAIWTQIGEVGPLSDPAHDAAQPGVKSGTYRLEAKATSWSRDVRAEGNSVIRTYDTTTQNHANTVGMVLPDMKAAQLADPTIPLKLPKDCEYLTKYQKAGTVQGTSQDWARMRDPSSVSPPTKVQHAFHGDKAPRPAFRHTATIGTTRIPINIPRSGLSDTGRPLATVDQIAKALAVLPPPQLAAIRAVDVSPMSSPDNAYWQKRFKNPSHVAGAANGNPVTFYPDGTNTSQDWLDGAMIHEAGHNVEDAYWAKNPGAEQRWRLAAASDGPNMPSAYAANAFANGSASEDFAETLVVYSLAKNTPCEAYARLLYGNRFRELDRIFKPKPPLKPRILTGNNPAGTQ